MNVILLGRNLGTADSWEDIEPNVSLIFFNFTPAEGIHLPGPKPADGTEVHLVVNFTTGLLRVSAADDSAVVLAVVDTVTLLSTLPILPIEGSVFDLPTDLRG
jgi:hypothetical protein